MANYDMKINVVAHKQFYGKFFDLVPRDFLILSQTIKIKNDNNEFISYNYQGTSTDDYLFNEEII